MLPQAIQCVLAELLHTVCLKGYRETLDILFMVAGITWKFRSQSRGVHERALTPRIGA